MWHFDTCRLRRVSAAPLLSFETPNDMQSVANNSHRIFKRLAKALIRLRVCAGWSEPLLVAYTTLLEISCRGSYFVIQSVSLLLVLSKLYHLYQVKWKSLEKKQ